MNKKIDAKGFSLIEIILVLTIAGIIIATAIRYYNSVVTLQRVQELVSKIQTITGTIEKVAEGGDISYSKLITPSNISSLFPEKQALLTPWGNRMSINLNHDNYYINIGTIPLDACVLFVTKLDDHYLQNKNNNPPIRELDCTSHASSPIEIVYRP